jgi:hypothetical protein
MPNPTFKASTSIPAYSCVKISTPGFVTPASSGESIIGITSSTAYTANQEVEFQDDQQDTVILTAASGINQGIMVDCISNGKVGPSQTGLFQTVSRVSAGQTFIAIKTSSSSTGKFFVFNQPAGYTGPAYPNCGVGLTQVAFSTNYISNPVTSDVNQCNQIGYDETGNCNRYNTFIGVTTSSVVDAVNGVHAYPGQNVELQEYDAVQVTLAETVIAGDKLTRQWYSNGRMAKLPRTDSEFPDADQTPWVAVALQGGTNGSVIWAMLVGSFRQKQTY